MRSSTILLLSTLIFSIIAQPNYQERAIYLDENDNPCRGVREEDYVNLVIYVSGKETIRTTLDSTTLCYQDVIEPSQALCPSVFMDYSDSSQGHYVYLKDETRYITHFGKLYRIIEKTTITIDNPIKLYGRTDYKCVIIGDGKIQHWGVNFKEYEPASITMSCVEPE